MQEDQRTRTLEAIAAALAERDVGAARPSAAALRSAAGISAARFDELFADAERAVLAAFELSFDRVAEWVVPAYRSEPRWLDAIRAGLAAFLRFLEAEPSLGRLLLLHASSAGLEVQRRRVDALALAARIVHRGGAEAADGERPPEVIAEGAVGGALAVVSNHLPDAQQPAPIELFGALSSMIVLPYLGPRVARRELTRPPPRLRTPAERPARAPLQSAREPAARVTYRTLRVLSAIRDYPGASNREVAERAGIVDQGQISKLLGRLEARALIVKRGEGRARGAPNAWRLTEHGSALIGVAAARAVAAEARAAPGATDTSRSAQAKARRAR